MRREAKNYMYVLHVRVTTSYMYFYIRQARLVMLTLENVSKEGGAIAEIVTKRNDATRSETTYYM